MTDSRVRARNVQIEHRASCIARYDESMKVQGEVEKGRKPPIVGAQE